MTSNMKLLLVVSPAKSFVSAEKKQGGVGGGVKLSSLRCTSSSFLTAETRGN